MLMLFLLQWFTIKLLNCSTCCVPGTITVRNTRTGNTHPASVISEECAFMSKISYMPKPTEALSGVHINVTIANVSVVHAITVMRLIRD